MLRFALIGAGRIGAVHGASIAAHPGASLALVADPDEGAAGRLATRFGARATADVTDVYTAADVDAVIVGSPTPLHVEHLTGAVAAGKAVLVEKPVDLDIARVDACIAAVGEDARRVMVGFNRRFDPAFAEVRSRSGEVGPVEQVTIISRDPAPPPAQYVASSGGLFRDMAIHDLDMARFLVGEIASVHAVGQRLGTVPEPDVDGAVTTLVAESGAVVTIVNSRHCATGYDQRLEVFGPLGSLEVGNVRATTVRHHGATTSAATGPYLDFFLERYATAYARELDHFVTAITAGEAPSPTLADGRAALELADAATLSAATGETVRLRSSAPTEKETV